MYKQLYDKNLLVKLLKIHFSFVLLIVADSLKNLVHRMKIFSGKSETETLLVMNKTRVLFLYFLPDTLYVLYIKCTNLFPLLFFSGVKGFIVKELVTDFLFKPLASTFRKPEVLVNQAV